MSQNYLKNHKKFPDWNFTKEIVTFNIVNCEIPKITFSFIFSLNSAGIGAFISKCLNTKLYH